MHFLSLVFNTFWTILMWNAAQSEQWHTWLGLYSCSKFRENRSLIILLEEYIRRANELTYHGQWRPSPGLTRAVYQTSAARQVKHKHADITVSTFWVTDWERRLLDGLWQNLDSLSTQQQPLEPVCLPLSPDSLALYSLNTDWNVSSDSPNQGYFVKPPQAVCLFPSLLHSR